MFDLDQSWFAHRGGSAALLPKNYIKHTNEYSVGLNSNGSSFCNQANDKNNNDLSETGDESFCELSPGTCLGEEFLRSVLGGKALGSKSNIIYGESCVSFNINDDT